jgi:hypothetical protein
MQSYRSLYGLRPEDPTPNVVWDTDGAVERKRVKAPAHRWWLVMLEDVIVRDSPAELTSVPTPPKRFGAVRHPFARKLVVDPKHRKRLSEDDLCLVMTWFDVQVPYFDTYMQQVGKALVRVKVDPYAPFDASRELAIHYPDGG